MHNPSEFGFSTCLEDGFHAFHIGPMIVFGILLRLGNSGFGRKINQDIGAEVPDRLSQHFGVQHIPDNDAHSPVLDTCILQPIRRLRNAPVICKHAMSARFQLRTCMSTQEARSAGDQNSHFRQPLLG